MRWPWMLRKTHERELAARVESVRGVWRERSNLEKRALQKLLSGMMDLSAHRIEGEPNLALGAVIPVSQWAGLFGPDGWLNAKVPEAAVWNEGVVNATAAMMINALKERQVQAADEMVEKHLKRLETRLP